MNAIPTLKKISEHLNISISTVSRALKDHPDVSAETIRRVKELAEMLEYEPNAFAVNLRKRKSDTYAILVPEISGYFYHSFIQSVEEEARRKGFGVMILQSMDEPDIEVVNLKICRYNHVSGIFLAISSHTKDYSAFKKTEVAGIPIVFFDKVPSGDEFTSISIADIDAGKEAALRMEAAGKRKICCIMGNPDLSISQRREKGFLEQWRSSHSDDPIMIYALNEDDAFNYIMGPGKKGLDDTAIFCMSDEILGGVMRALYKLGVSIPKEVSILAMSNGQLPRFFNPEVSYLQSSGYQLGKLCIKAMEKRHNGVAAETIKEMVQCQFFEGESL
jgi:LacI family transcriptional regulator